MGASVRPLATPDDAEFQAWKASQSAPQAPPTHDDAEFQQWKAAQDRAATLHSGVKAPADFMTSALDNATFGLSTKATALGTAGLTAIREGLRHPSENLAPLASQVYKQDLAALRTAQSQYHEAHPALDTAAQIGGAVAPVVLSGGLGSVAEAADLTRVGRFAKTVATGAKFGAANAAGHSDALEDGQGVAGLAHDIGKGALIGGAVGAASIPASAVAGKLVRASGLPGAVSAGAGKLAPLLPPGRLQRGAQAISGALGQEGEAAQVIARRARMDEQGGFTPTPLHPSIPPMALDAAGPNVEGLAEGIAQKPGPGRAAIVKAVDTRAKQMRPAITSELEKGTGVPADNGLQPLQQAIDARGAEAKQLYDAARLETKGQPVTSETFEQIKATPAGKKALQVAQAQQGNLFRAGGESVPDGYSPEQWAGVKTTMQERGIAVPDNVGSATQALPDPETLHLMKQHLAQLAKLGTQDGEGGTLSAGAKGALSVWGKVREELPDVWKKADDAYAARSRVIDAMNRGRQVFSTPVNPSAPTAQKALGRSLGGLDAKLAAASPEEQGAAQVGAATAAHARLGAAPNSVKSPGRIFSQSPQQVQQLGHAFPTPDAASDFQHAVSGWDKVQEQKGRLVDNSRTALRGNEGNSRDLIQPGSVLRAPKRVLASLIDALNHEYEAGTKQELDATIAKMLTSPDLQTVPNAQRAGVLRDRLIQALRLGTAGVGAEKATR